MILYNCQNIGGQQKMNKLSGQQKSILTQTLQNDKSIYMAQDLPEAVMTLLEKINNFEDLDNAVNRFIWDYNTEREMAGRLSIKGGR
jgi:hypothetical protein